MLDCVATHGCHRGRRLYNKNPDIATGGSVKKLVSFLLLAVPVLLPAAQPAAGRDGYRTVQIRTTEVTQPAITVSPDGQTLVFTILGHLFRMPAAGGTATQLTFGPTFNYDPAFSPDGRRVAFISNRDGSDANVFVLDLASGRATRLAREMDANRPVWSPDGRTVAFASNLRREDHPLSEMPGFGDYYLRDVKTVPARGGRATTVARAQHADMLFYLPDGRLAWSDRDGGGGGMRGAPQVTWTRILVQQADGSVSPLLETGANIGRGVAAAAGDAVYYVLGGTLQRLAFAPGAAPAAGIAVQNGARLAMDPAGDALYYGERGGLWRASLPAGQPRRVDFEASVQMTVRAHVDRTWQVPQPGATARLRAVLAPTVSPDGSRVAFIAGGFLYEQPLAGGEPRRIVAGNAFLRDPAYSPDGRRIAFVASEGGKRYLRVHEFASGQTRDLYVTGGAQWPLYPAWSPDGRRIVFEHAQNLGAPFPILVVDVATGATREVTRTVGSWVARPQFSADGTHLYFTNRAGKIATLDRIALQPDATPEPLSALTRHVHEALVSPDGKWMAQRRNAQIWVAPMDALPIRDAQLRRFSAEGGRSFSFTPDSSAIVYAANGRLYRQRLGERKAHELPVEVTVTRQVAPPLLLSRVRVLDLDAGKFSDETSMFIENGRIGWIGDESGHTLPAGTVRVDAAGRHAIPGLIDSHVHSAWANAQANEDAFIAFGVTTIRDTGGQADVLAALRDRSETTLLPAPRYFYSGEIFEGVMPFWGDAFSQVATEAEARAQVRALKKAGVDYVKIYPSIPYHLQAAVTDEAWRQGLPNVGHGILYQEMILRLIWGANSLEHGSPVTGSYNDVHQILAATGTVSDLTLSVGGGALMRAQEPQWESDWRVREFVPEESRSGRAGMGGGGVAPDRDALLTAFAPMFERIVTAKNAGVQLGAGTDSMMGGVFFGLNTHWEIAQFVDAGLAPIDALRLATVDAARLVGAAADLGVLAEGKLGDVLLLDADPLQDIRNTQSIWRVVKGGQVHDPAALRQ